MNSLLNYYIIIILAFFILNLTCMSNLKTKALNNLYLKLNMPLVKKLKININAINIFFIISFI